MTPICFETRQLVKYYGAKAVVDGLSFCVREGEIVGLLGPNGAGKTTAFYMSIGLIRPDGGEVWFKGENVTEIPLHKRAQMGMGYLAQEPSVFRGLTVEENILAILQTLPLSAVLKQLVRLLANKGISVLITDHNAREIFSLVDRSYLIQEGRVTLEGPSEILLNHEEARRTYFGSDFRL